MTVQKIGIISQDGTDPSYVLGAYFVLNNLLSSCNAGDKYQVFNVENSSPFVGPLVRKGIERAMAEKRYMRDTYLQINAEPIVDGLLSYTNIHPDTEFLMIMRNSIYAENLNYFLGNNVRRPSLLGQLMNTTIISTGKGSPYEMDGLTFQTILMHELGHRFGATDYRNRERNELHNYTHLGTHCVTPGCIMNVASSLRDGRLAARRRATYCPGCLAAMKKEFSR